MWTFFAIFPDRFGTLPRYGQSSLRGQRNSRIKSHIGASSCAIYPCLNYPATGLGPLLSRIGEQCIP